MRPRRSERLRLVIRRSLQDMFITAIPRSLIRIILPVLLGSVFLAGKPRSEPVITGITPQCAPPGTLIAVTGSGFGTDRDSVTVGFAGPEQAEGAVVEVADDTLQVIVPVVTSGSYLVSVTVSSGTSNAEAFTVAQLPTIPDPLDVINSFLDDVDAQYDTWVDAEPGSSLCTPSPGNTAFENLGECQDALVAAGGMTISPEDLAATMAVLRSELRDAVPEMTPEEQLLFAQLLVTSGAADSLGSLPGSMTQYTQGVLESTAELPWGLRCCGRDVTLFFDYLSFMTGALSTICGPFGEASVARVLNITSIAFSALSCAMNCVADEMEYLTIIPSSVNLGDGNCTATFGLMGHFTNGCLCVCSFTVGLVWPFEITVLVPFPAVTADVAIDPDKVVWTGTGPIEEDPEYPSLRATDAGSASLEARVYCNHITRWTSASIVIKGEVCDAIDNDCDGAVDDGLLCCVDGQAKDCDDGNACTFDYCDGNTGNCVHAPIECPPTGNPCTISQCNPSVGCEVVNRPNGTSCSDEKGCTGPDECVNGVCTGPAKDCSYLDDTCHLGACQEPGGNCVAAPVTCGPDGDPCTEDLSSCDPELGCNPPITQCVGGDGCCPPGCNGQNDSDCPAAVSLVSFEAFATPDTVRVEWVTGTELDVASFNILRRASEAGGYDVANPHPIPAIGSPVSGHAYEFLDLLVQPGAVYFYKLEEII